MTHYVPQKIPMETETVTNTHSGMAEQQLNADSNAVYDGRFIALANQKYIKYFRFPYSNTYSTSLIFMIFTCRIHSLIQKSTSSKLTTYFSQLSRISFREAYSLSMVSSQPRRQHTWKYFVIPFFSAMKSISFPEDNLHIFIA